MPSRRVRSSLTLRGADASRARHREKIHRPVRWDAWGSRTRSRAWRCSLASPAGSFMQARHPDRRRHDSEVALALNAPSPARSSRLLRKASLRASPRAGRPQQQEIVSGRCAAAARRYRAPGASGYKRKCALQNASVCACDRPAQQRIACHSRCGLHAVRRATTHAAACARPGGRNIRCEIVRWRSPSPCLARSDTISGEPTVAIAELGTIIRPLRCSTSACEQVRAGRAFRTCHRGCPAR